MVGCVVFHFSMLIRSHALQIPLRDESVQCVVTSPPYWGLRKYEGEQELVWSADGADSADCEHEWGTQERGRRKDVLPSESSAAGRLGTHDGQSGQNDGGRNCLKCGAWRGPLGHEPLHDCLAWTRVSPNPESLAPSPQLCNRCYVCHMVLIFREVRRVLRDDGTCWLNLGDAMSSGGRNDHGTRIGYKQETNRGSAESKNWRAPQPPGLKPKDLCGIPWRVAMALQADGWYLRSDIIWSKPNPMPESIDGWRWEKHRIKAKASVRKSKQEHLPEEGKRPGGNRGNALSDVQNQPLAEWIDCPGCETCELNGGLVLRRGAWRPTKSHEYIFLLSKSEDYFCDREAVAEAAAESSLARINQATFNHQTGGPKDYARTGINPNRSARKALENFADNGGKRNLRSVWEIPTQPYSGSRFATFPERIPEIAIRAGTSEKACCPKCGAPWGRVVKGSTAEAQSHKRSYFDRGKTAIHQDGRAQNGARFDSATTGWKPTCQCDAGESVPCLVLDPFAGSGTVGEVAYKLGRRFVLCDLAYQDLQRARIGEMAIRMNAGAAPSPAAS